MKGVTLQGQPIIVLWYAAHLEHAWCICLHTYIGIVAEFIMCCIVLYSNHVVFHTIAATGLLKGYDQLLNLVLDGTTEHMQGMCKTEQS